MKYFFSIKQVLLFVALLFAQFVRAQQPPVADFNYSYILPNKIQFTDQSTQFPTSWQWAFDDGGGSVVQNPVHTYSSLGPKNVCLVATNSFGSSSTKCKQILITSVANIGIYIGPTVSLCTGNTVTLRPQTAGGTAPFTYYWSSTANNLSCNNCATPQTTVTQNAVYTVTVVDAYHNSATASVTYVVNGNTGNIQLTATSTVIDCANPVSTVNALASGGTPPYSYLWNDFDTTSSAQRNFSIAGSKVITVVDSWGCRASVIEDIVNQGVVVTLTDTIHPGCENQNTGKIELGATGGTAPYTYTWNGSGTGNIKLNVPAGVYEVTVTDAANCSGTLTYNLSPKNGWGYFVFAETQKQGCANNGLINTTVYNGVAPYSYLWSNGSTQPALTGLSPAVYHVTVTDALGCTTSGFAPVSGICYSLITGNVFNDLNQNCQPDAGEPAGHLYVRAYNGMGYLFANVQPNGSFKLYVADTGTYTLQLSSGNGCNDYYICDSTALTVYVPGVDDTVYTNIGYVGLTTFDLSLRATWDGANPGFIKTYNIWPQDNSYSFNGIATVVFKYDTNLIFQNATHMPVHNSAAHTLTWSVDTSIINKTNSAGALKSEFLVPPNVDISYTILYSDFSISPTTGDCNLNNNTISTQQPVTGSYDPNEKVVSPWGDVTESDSVFTYTIHFQNTGNDSTHFVILKDTLPTYLNPATVENIASSHPYSNFQLSGEGILTWVFNPLRLVDSATDEAHSKGFVMFRIKRKANAPVGTVIKNRAAIYFDYNEPILTNYTGNKVVAPNGISVLSNTNGIGVQVYPNPFNTTANFVVEGVQGNYNFELYDLTGQLKFYQKDLTTNTFTINRNNLSAGIYIYRIKTNNGQYANGKLVVE